MGGPVVRAFEIGLGLASGRLGRDDRVDRGCIRVEGKSGWIRARHRLDGSVVGRRAATTTCTVLVVAAFEVLVCRCGGSGRRIARQDVHRHVLVLHVEHIVVQNVVIASLFFEKVAISLRMQL